MQQITDCHLQGFLKLLEGDVVFVCGSQAPNNGEADAVVCWVTGR